MRLIDADKFIEVIENKMFDSPLMHPVMEMMDLLGLIEEQSTVDAVEVVRCKDCFHFDAYGSRDAFGICNLNYGSERRGNEDYCSNGIAETCRIDCQNREA